MKKSFLAAISVLIILLCACEEDNTLAVDFNHSYRTISANSFEALVVPFVNNSSQLGASGIYYGTDSILTNLNSTKLVSTATSGESFSIIVHSLNYSETYYWQPYIEVNWQERKGDVLSFKTDSAPPCLGIGCPGPAGGYIFYEDGFGGGLEAAPFVISKAWGCDGVLIGGTSIVLGTGQANTTTIVSTCLDSDIAAYACDSLNYGGFSDWYLPSLDEVGLIDQNLYQMSIGAYPSGVYSSSSELSANMYHGYLFSTGPPLVTEFKPEIRYVIPVRTF